MDPDEDAMYTLMTMVRTLVRRSVSFREDKTRAGSLPRSAGCLCVAGSADDLRKSARVWMELCVLHPPPLFCLLSTHSFSLSLSLCRATYSETRPRTARTERGAGLSERRDSGVITSDNYGTDSIVHKSHRCPRVRAYVRGTQVFSR